MHEIRAFFIHNAGYSANHPRITCVERMIRRLRGRMKRALTKRPVHVLQANIVGFYSIDPVRSCAPLRSYTDHNRLMPLPRYTLSKRLDDTLRTSYDIRSIERINE
jgi:hypothetical protein